ncbi:MAG: hypothetical protein ABSF54_16815 [Bryobacteraceae bacterium]
MPETREMDRAVAKPLAKLGCRATQLLLPQQVRQYRGFLLLATAQMALVGAGAMSGRVSARKRSHQTVVFGVIADPIPDDFVFLHNCQSAVIKTDASRINVILPFQFLELQARMRQIALEETIGALCVPLGVCGQAGKQTPEPPGGP